MSDRFHQFMKSAAITREVSTPEVVEVKRPDLGSEEAYQEALRSFMNKHYAVPGFEFNKKQ